MRRTRLRYFLTALRGPASQSGPKRHIGANHGFLGQHPFEFFFNGVPHVSSQVMGARDVPPSFVADFLTTSEGVQLMRAFVRITDATVRRRLISLVKAIGGDENE